MRGAVLHGPRDIRFEERADPTIVQPTDAIIKMAATCVCGSTYALPRSQPGHGAEPDRARVLRHGGRGRSDVTWINQGPVRHRFVFPSDNTCPHCRAGYQTSCQHREPVLGAQAPYLRVPVADGTLVSYADIPSDDAIPNLLALSDVMGTGWFAAEAANVKPGMTVAVVGDGAVGLLGVLSAKQMGAKRIIAISPAPGATTACRDFGATDIVTERGDDGIARIKELTKGVGADAVLECVGTQSHDAGDSIHAARRRRFGYVGVPAVLS